MLTLRDHRSRDLFDPWEYLGPQRRRLLKRSWAGVFRDFLLERLPVNELIPHFRKLVDPSGKIRPSILPPLASCNNPEEDSTVLAGFKAPIPWPVLKVLPHS